MAADTQQTLCSASTHWAFIYFYFSGAHSRGQLTKYIKDEKYNKFIKQQQKCNMIVFMLPQWK